MKVRNFLALSLTLGVAFLAVPAIAKADPLPAACGNDTTQYKVSHGKTTPSLTPPAGQALVVLIQKETGQEFPSDPTVRFAVDGTWVGAVKGASYIAVPISAGSHKLCVSRQSSLDDEKENIGTAPLDAKAGSVYYFEFTLDREDVGSSGRVSGGSAAAYPAGSSMTAKRRDATDTAAFTELKDTAAPTHMQKLKPSVWTVK
ncbi:MAG TPA: hypothetical protein VK814_17930 [Acidobacteriaceae bacterium]|jgi:hypothetical protein|nr:hypothetical protein [Acidobacteriaceae bacterium]